MKNVKKKIKRITTQPKLPQEGKTIDAGAQQAIFDYGRMKGREELREEIFWVLGIEIPEEFKTASWKFGLK
jgi:hypothetical protein